MQKLKVDMDIGANLRQLRKEHHTTQEHLVTKLGLLGVEITRAVYSRYETGELNVPVSVIVGLHTIYGCSYDAFFAGLRL